MSRGSTTPLAASILAISALATVGTARVARVHLDLQTARNGADLAAVSLAAGADAGTVAAVARLNGTDLVSLDRSGGVSTVLVRRGQLVAVSSATAASVD